jgi:hypothetical protein
MSEFMHLYVCARVRMCLLTGWESIVLAENFELYDPPYDLVMNEWVYACRYVFMYICLCSCEDVCLYACVCMYYLGLAQLFYVLWFFRMRLSPISLCSTNNDVCLITGFELIALAENFELCDPPYEWVSFCIYSCMYACASASMYGLESISWQGIWVICIHIYKYTHTYIHAQTTQHARPSQIPTSHAPSTYPQVTHIHTQIKILM